jgi:hypothetical protein
MVRKNEPTRRRKRGKDESETRPRTVLLDNDTGNFLLCSSQFSEQHSTGRVGSEEGGKALHPQFFQAEGVTPCPVTLPAACGFRKIGKKTIPSGRAEWYY